MNLKVCRAAKGANYLYNPSHELGTDIQRVVLHHVKGHSAHHQHMLLIVEVHTAVKYRREEPVNIGFSFWQLEGEECHLVAKSDSQNLIKQRPDRILRFD